MMTSSLLLFLEIDSKSACFHLSVCNEILVLMNFLTQVSTNLLRLTECQPVQTSKTVRAILVQTSLISAIGCKLVYY